MKIIFFLILISVSFCLQQVLSPDPIKIPLRKHNLSRTEKQAMIALLRHTQLSPIQLSLQPTSFLSLRSQITSKIPLKNFGNTQFVGEIGLGTPPQWLDIIFDTGSGNFFINSELCKDQSCKSRPRYDHEKSLTYEPQGGLIEVEFGTGGIEGEINRDILILGNLRVGQQEFCETVSETGEVFLGGEFSGIMGLSFPSLAAPGTNPVFETLIENGMLPANIITFYYSLNEEEQSEITFGEIDHTSYIGTITWIPLIEDLMKYWLIEIEDIRLDGESLGLCDPICKGAVDTGTTLIAAPSNALNALYEALDSDCNNYEDYPDLVFVIQGKDFRIPPKDYVITIGSEGEDNPGEHSNEYDECSLAMIALNVPPPDGPLWVLGDIFLANFYSIFDRDNLRVGLAQSAHS